MKNFAIDLDSISSIEGLYSRNSNNVSRYSLNLKSEYVSGDSYVQCVGRVWDEKMVLSSHMIFYLTLSKGNLIFYREAYQLIINEMGEIEKIEIFHSKVDSLKYTSFTTDFEANNKKRFSTSFLERTPGIGGGEFGFACGYHGDMPEIGQEMMRLVKSNNFEELKIWSYTLNAQKQAYAYVGILQLKHLGKISQEEFNKLSLVRIEQNRKTFVNSCGGCDGRLTNAFPETLGEIVTSEEVKKFILGF